MSDEVSSKPACGWPGYSVTDSGEVVSKKNPGKYLVRHTDKDGYQTVTLRKDGRSFNRSVHRLVLETFVGPCPGGMECRHLDGDPSNNYLGNLEWSTHLKNIKDKSLHRTHPDRRGSKHPLSKLSEDDVRAIRADSRAVRVIAADYGVSNPTIHGIKARRTWKHV